ncbi:hypothetical protein GC163_06175 [bacterium]|nr:hypothetical protein [bacterium]
MASPTLGDRQIWEVFRRGAVAAGAAGWDFLFPPSCLLCAAEPLVETNFCDACRQEVTAPVDQLCQRCSAPVGPNLNTQRGCVYCREERFAFRRVLALGPYESTLRRTILTGKTAHGAPHISALTDMLIDSRLPELLVEPFDAIVPVPHHWQRRFWQLHAASETVAERLASRLRRRYAPHILRKPKATPLQSSSTPSERRKQQRGAFTTPEGCRLDGLRLLLVDDVLTTGATAHAATQALIAAGAADVLVVVLARGLGHRGSKLH